MKKILRKLNNRRGESLSEVLIALLISSLGIALLAVMITSSVRMITESRTTVESYVAAENALAVRTGSTGQTGTVTLTNNGGHDQDLTDNVSSDIPVTYYVNSVIGGKPVIAYRKGN